MNMLPRAKLVEITKFPGLCRNPFPLMKSMQTALGVPAKYTARCGACLTSIRYFNGFHQLNGVGILAKPINKAYALP